jgi:hypothetical protein
MRLDVKGLAIAMSILAGSALLLVGLGNVGVNGYGAAVLDVAASVYPGYHGPEGMLSVLVVTLYAMLDGAIFGALLAWLYNRFGRVREAGEQRFTA